MMTQLFSRVGKRSRHDNYVCSPFSCSSVSFYNDARCIKPSGYYNHQHRWNSGSSSSNNNTDDDAAATTATESITKRRRRSRTKKKSLSPLLQITSNHPKNSKPPYCYTSTFTKRSDTKLLLTRKQLLRLTPKQRSNLHKYRLQQYKDSMSYLQQARTNVRTNLNYLSDTAGSNFKKNMATIQRLFRGEEEVWKEQEPTAIAMGGSKRQQKSSNHPLKPQHQEEDGIDWERLPSELKQNVQSNLVTVQNWLHKATDGMIPSPSLVNTDGTTATNTASSSRTGGSVATRVQQFHQAKQTSGLVMDRTWLTWNIALALSPGVLWGLYLYSLQDEMKEYYVKLEEQERARILGPSLANYGGRGGAGGVDDKKRDESTKQQQTSSNNEKKGMGISSALILEGGGVFDKVKMAVNDLFLGGVEERVGKARSDAEAEEDDDTTEQQSTTLASTQPAQGDSVNTSTANQQSPNESSEATLDPTMKILLQRIESLEKQLGIENKETNLTDEQEEQRQREQHTDNYIKERTRQSPMQNRRDSSLATKWSEEEKRMKSSQKAAVISNDESESTTDESRSITLWKFVQGVKSLLENDANSAREMIRQKIETLEDLLVSTSMEEERCEEVNNEAQKVVENAEESEGNTTDASERVDMRLVEASTTAVEKTTEEMEVVEQAKDTQKKGFRAWISRLFREQK